jgi:hypothetical protein
VNPSPSFGRWARTGIAVYLRKYAQASDRRRHRNATTVAVGVYLTAAKSCDNVRTFSRSLHTGSCQPRPRPLSDSLGHRANQFRPRHTLNSFGAPLSFDSPRGAKRHPKRRPNAGRFSWWRESLLLVRPEPDDDRARRAHP